MYVRIGQQLAHLPGERGRYPIESVEFALDIVLPKGRSASEPDILGHVPAHAGRMEALLVLDFRDGLGVPGLLQLVCESHKFINSD